MRVEDYINAEGYARVLPCAKTKDDAINIYNRWSNEQERNELERKYGYGFAAIEID